MPLPDIIIYSKPGCCLCEQAKNQLDAIKEKHPFNIREVNILDDPSTYRMFKDEIPVIFINGRKAFKYRLDEIEFIRLLNSRNQEPQEEATPAT